jgi:endonuclease/exonuclease/phosphatase family metal-dependent hydrolase
MKLISLNVEFFGHRAHAVSFIKGENPDVICLQELIEGDVEELKKELGYEGIYKPQSYLSSNNYGGPQNKRYGNAILTKHPIKDSGYSFYVGKEENIEKEFEDYFSDEAYRENRVLLWADIIVGGETFRFITVHFFLTYHGEVTPLQLQALDSLFTALDPLGEFVLVGDMNAPRGKETFDRLAKKYKDNIPQEYQTSLDLNLHRARHNPIELENISKFMVDGLFTTPSYTASDVHFTDGVSDHMAIVADIERSDMI